MKSAFDWLLRKTGQETPLEQSPVQNPVSVASNSPILSRSLNGRSSPRGSQALYQQDAISPWGKSLTPKGTLRSPSSSPGSASPKFGGLAPRAQWKDISAAAEATSPGFASRIAKEVKNCQSPDGSVRQYPSGQQKYIMSSTMPNVKLKGKSKPVVSVHRSTTTPLIPISQRSPFMSSSLTSGFLASATSSMSELSSVVNVMKFPPSVSRSDSVKDPTSVEAVVAALKSSQTSRTGVKRFRVTEPEETNKKPRCADSDSSSENIPPFETPPPPTGGSRKRSLSATPPEPFRETVSPKSKRRCIPDPRVASLSSSRPPIYNKKSVDEESDSFSMYDSDQESDQSIESVGSRISAKGQVTPLPSTPKEGSTCTTPGGTTANNSTSSSRTTTPPRGLCVFTLDAYNKDVARSQLRVNRLLGSLFNTSDDDVDDATIEKTPEPSEKEPPVSEKPHSVPIEPKILALSPISSTPSSLVSPVSAAKAPPPPAYTSVVSSSPVIASPPKTMPTPQASESPLVAFLAKTCPAPNVSSPISMKTPTVNTGSTPKAPPLVPSALDVPQPKSILGGASKHSSFSLSPKPASPLVPVTSSGTPAFSFGSGTSAPSISFGTSPKPSTPLSTPIPAPPTSTVAPPTASKPSFEFGKTASNDSPVVPSFGSKGGFSFSKPATTAPPTVTEAPPSFKPTLSFGATPTALTSSTSTSVESSQTNMFSFGPAKPSASTASTLPTFSASKPAFGDSGANVLSNSGTTLPSAGSLTSIAPSALFSATAASGSSAPAFFGAKSTVKPPTSAVAAFGAAGPTSSAPSSLLGMPAPTSFASSSSMFGASVSTSLTKTSASSVFGVPTPTSNAPVSSSTVFGTSSTTAAPVSSVFGVPAPTSTAPAPSSVFGVPTPAGTAPAPSSVFGIPTPTATAPTPAFGQSSGGISSGSPFTFGGSKDPEPPNKNMFGATSSASFAFGAASATSTTSSAPSFGASSAFSFGSQTSSVTSTGTAPSLFGASSAATTKAFDFGAAGKTATSAPSSTFSFGSSSGTPSTFTFGAKATDAPAKDALLATAPKPTAFGAPQSNIFAGALSSSGSSVPSSTSSAFSFGSATSTAPTSTAAPSGGNFFQFGNSSSTVSSAPAFGSSGFGAPSTTAAASPFSSLPVPSFGAATPAPSFGAGATPQFGAANPFGSATAPSFNQERFNFAGNNSSANPFTFGGAATPSSAGASARRLRTRQQRRK